MSFEFITSIAGCKVMYFQAARDFLRFGVVHEFFDVHNYLAVPLTIRPEIVVDRMAEYGVHIVHSSIVYKAEVYASTPNISNTIPANC